MMQWEKTQRVCFTTPHPNTYYPVQAASLPLLKNIESNGRSVGFAAVRIRSSCTLRAGLPAQKIAPLAISKSYKELFWVSCGDV